LTGYKDPSGNYRIELATSGGNQSFNHEKKYISSSECDLLFLYCLDGTMYEVPSAVLEGKGAMLLGKKWSSYKL
jgi:hypothetical protein